LIAAIAGVVVMVSGGIGSADIKGIAYAFMAAQVPLLALGETALAPLWVWLIINETPARNTLIGGALVLAVVLFQGFMGLRSR